MLDSWSNLIPQRNKSQKVYVMRCTVSDLVKLLPPPEEPTYCRGDWNAVQDELGTELPSDFREFCEVYGAVNFSGLLWFHTPFYFVGESAYTPFTSAPQPYRELLLSRLNELDAVVGGRDSVDCPNFPDEGGLLPIGATDNGDLIAWITKGDPDKWDLFFWAFPGVNVFSLADTNVCGMLFDLATGTSPLVPHGLPEQLFGQGKMTTEVIS